MLKNSKKALNMLKEIVADLKDYELTNVENLKLLDMKDEDIAASLMKKLNLKSKNSNNNTNSQSGISK